MLHVFALEDLPCSMKILREFYFADWRFFVVWGNKLSGRNLNMVFSTFILPYVESKFTLLTYFHCYILLHKWTEQQQGKTKQKPIPNIHDKSIKSRVFNLTEGS